MTVSTLIALGLAFLVSQQSKPADPAALLERAQIAYDLGSPKEARSFLEAALAAGALPEGARPRADALRRALDRGAPAQTQPSSGSPLLRRFNEALLEYYEGHRGIQQMQEMIDLVGEESFAPVAARVESSGDTLATAEKTFDLLDFIARRYQASERVVREVARFAESEDPLVRGRALRVLGGLPPEGKAWARELGPRFVASPRPEARVLAIRWLATSLEDLRPYVPKLARDPNESVREALVDAATPALGEAERAALARDPSAQVRGAVVRSCKAGRWPDPVAALLLLARDPDYDVARESLAALRGRAIPDAHRALAIETYRALLKAPSDPLRELVVNQVGISSLGSAGFLILLDYSQDPSDRVVQAAASRFVSQPMMSEWRRDQIPAAIAALRHLVARFGVRTQKNPGNGYADALLESFTSLVATVATADDFPALAPLLSEIPDLAATRVSFVSVVLSKANVSGLPALQKLLESSDDPRMRSLALQRAVEIAASAGFEAVEALVPLIRAGLAKGNDASLRAASIRGALRLGLVALEADVLASIDGSMARALNPKDLVASSPEAQRLAVRVLSKLARVRAVEWRDMTADVCVAIGVSSPEDIAPVVEILLDEPACRAVLSNGTLGYALRNLARAIARLESSESREALERVAREAKVPEARAAAVGALELDRSPDSERYLLESALPDPEVSVAGAAIDALLQRRAFDEAAVRGVEGRIADPNEYLRARACRYFSSWNDLRSVPYLRRFLKDTNYELRLGACEALGHFLVDEAVPELLEMLADPNQNVRTSAKDVLERIRFYQEEKRRWQEWGKGGGGGAPEAAAKLVKALDDADADVRIAAAQSLATLKAKEALPALVERLKAASGVEREALAKAIAKIAE